MNKVNPQSEYQGPPAPEAKVNGRKTEATSGKVTASRKVADELHANAEILHRVLSSGDQALAQRRDLVELHKRLVATITSLGEGLNEAQAKKTELDRKKLGERLDSVEHAVNSMDSALRIELEPLLKRMVEESVERRVVAAGPRPGRKLGAAVLLVVGIALGAVFSGQIGDISASGWDAVRSLTGDAGASAHAAGAATRELR
ncbi:MAG: hypothetical protein ACP5DX_16475 [Paracoccaceae bacterium]